MAQETAHLGFEQRALEKNAFPAVGCSRRICQVVLVHGPTEPRAAGSLTVTWVCLSLRPLRGFAAVPAASVLRPTVCTPSEAAVAGWVFCPCHGPLSRAAPSPGGTLSGARLILPRDVHMLCLPALPPSACPCPGV